MVTLGMSAHTDRMLRLLVENGVTNTAVLERLTGERCMELNLFWVLVEAAQKRWTTEKMNLGQDKGGLIEKEDPFMKLLEANRARLTQKDVMMLPMLPNIPGTPVSGMVPGMYPGHMSEQMEDQMRRMTMCCNPSVRKFKAAQHGEHAAMESSQEAAQRTSHRCHNTKQALMETVNSSSSALLQKLDLTQQDLLKQSKESHQVLETVATNQGAFSKQLESGHEARKRLVEMEGTLEQKISDTGAEMRNCQVERAEGLMQHMQTELAGLSGAKPW
eukprot:s1640_g10.t1